jgi:hypothetical protein
LVEVEVVRVGFVNEVGDRRLESCWDVEIGSVKVCALRTERAEMQKSIWVGVLFWRINELRGTKGISQVT